MRKTIILFSLIFGLLGCFKSRQIEVKVTDVDSGNPVSGVQIIITDVEHHDSGNTETVIYTDDSGVARKNFSAPKKDMIKIQINGKNGYSIIDESTYYYNYQRKINISVSAKK